MVETLPLHLYGPLQSWGGPGAQDVRLSADMPSKSGLVGIMAAALGRVHGSDNSDLCGLELAVRTDRRGTRMVDFHTLPQKGDNTYQTWREYHQWAGFTAFVSGDEDLLCRVRDALRNPRWDLTLGRRNCHPATSIGGELLGVGIDEAITGYWPSYATRKSTHMVERDARKGESWLLVGDEPLGDRRFAMRPVTRFVVASPE